MFSPEMDGGRDAPVASFTWSMWTFWITAVLDAAACRSVSIVLVRLLSRPIFTTK